MFCYVIIDVTLHNKALYYLSPEHKIMKFVSPSKTYQKVWFVLFINVLSIKILTKFTKQV